ncbi:uncharacterized protein LOC100263121 isoform X2 [Vitis vinifera]|nr:uncharacterized protein LOC100263121 isoform X2 [Vitis vinifera]|eukprot:XP_002272167.2 PREDICTED: uncharacterized protein LOC100263121 isoform X2 [Vitis vinifera]
MADQGGSSAVTVMRDYRKGNWTVNETMILIEAKKMDDQRRMKRSGENEGRSKPAELRWKWVEDYCWRKGCLRSQNQCNDKWDNLMRDYKKVRDYERRLLSERGDSGDHDGGPSSSSSYWMIDKNERKEKNLPSNMLRQIYEGLVEVVERKGVGTTSSAAAAAHQRVMSGGGGGLGLGSIPNIGYVVDRIEPPLPPLLQHHNPSPVSVAALPPPPPLPPPPSAPQPPQQPQQPHIAYPQPLPSLDSDTSEYSDSPAKRRRRGGGEGTSGGTTTASGSSSIEVGSAISKSASIIAEAIQASEEREERRHRDLLSLLERRLKIEESKTEVNREGINGLVDAINNLANSILALASDRTQTPPQ